EVFDIRTLAAQTDMSGTTFPVFPFLGLQVPADGSNTTDLSFATAPGSKAHQLFTDYFFLLVRTLIQFAIDNLGARESMPLGTMLANLNTTGPLNHLAGMGSRFLLHGVRVRTGATTQSIFEATHQQFTIASAN